MILCNEWKEAEETIEVSYKLLEDWGETYQAQVSISNNSETEINCWKLGFNLTGSISEIWDSVLLSEENGTVIVSNNETNSTIAPENKANFSFIAKKNKDETPELSDFIIYENYINIEKGFEEIVPEIMGYADFNEDLLTINWYSTIEDGKFEVLKSLDNETFEVIEELENEKSYKYGEIDFEKAYFKIRQTLSDGRTAESAAVAIVYENGEFKWEYIDTDEEGIPDIYEESIGTDITNPDTDGDNLTDYEEIYLTNSDPLVYNSVNEEVSDSEADPDEDGVSNRTEIDNGTNPLLADSDYDGINDGEEAKIGTDPVSSDTDNDGIADGDELTLNLDPTSDTTDGIKDSERTTLQEIEADSEIMSEINTAENPMKVSIEFEAAGLAESSLDVSESGYSSAMSNSAIVGAIPEFSYPEGLSTGEVTVKFSVAESVKENTLGAYAEECEELKGIKRFNVFKYFEDTNMLLPIETFHDEEKGVVYTKTDCLGTYCVMDLELWMQNLGVEATTEELTETVDVSYLSAEEDEDAFEGLDNGNLNVVFFLDARCSISEEKFNSLKGFVCDALDDILSSYMLGVNLMVMISRGDKTVEVYSVSSADSIDVIRNLKQDSSSVPYGYSRTINVTACFDKLYEICKDNTNDTLFIMNVSEEEITAQISTSKEVFEKVRDNGKIHISLISETRTTEMISYVVNLIKETGGKIIRARTEAIKSYVGEYLSDSYSIITANNYELVKLKNRLERDSGEDTDEDDLSDWSEVDIEAVYELGGDSVNGKSYLEMYDMPTVAQCIDRYDDEHFYVESGFNQFHSEHSKRWEEYIKSIRITPIISDPTNVDSDGDGYYDGYEYNNSKTNPSQSDVTEYRLSSDYTIVIDSTERYYGGNQSWSEEKNRPFHYKSDLSLKGCGIIASCDSLLYIQKVKNIDSLTFVKFNEDKTINLSNYLDFVEYYYDKYRTTLLGFTFSTWYRSIAKMLDTYFNTFCNDYAVSIINAKKCFDDKSNFDFNYSWIDNTYNGFLNIICNSLKEDKPFILLASDSMDESVLMYKELLKDKNENMNKLNNLDELNSLSTHFVAVTGVISDRIKDDAIIEFSSWGTRYYISYKELIKKTPKKTDLIGIEIINIF